MLTSRNIRFAVTWMWLLSAWSADAQPGPVSGLYQIVSGRYTECRGFTGPFNYDLPDTDQAFVDLTVDPHFNLARMTFLGDDMETVFRTADWLPGTGFTFAFTNGIVYPDHIRFGGPILPPGPGLPSFGYTVGNSVDTLRINGTVVTPIIGADVPNQFKHTNVVATLVRATPVIDRLDRDGDTMRFHFSGQPPYDYTVEFNDSLTTMNWVAAAIYRAELESIDIVVTNSLTNAWTRYFRIRQDPCNCR